jgi:uncharacterized Tic20 family protein
MFQAVAMNEGPRTASGRLVDPHAQEWERLYATFTHLSLLTIHVLVPVIPALVMWLIKREKSPFIDDHGREAVNFQISLCLYAVIIIPIIGLLTCMVGWLLYIPLYIVGIVGMIMAALAANRGEYYRYPATIRLLH